MPARTLILMAIYAGLFALSLYASYLARFMERGNYSLKEVATAVLTHIIWIIPLKLGWLFVFGHFRSMIGYFRLPDMLRVIYGLTFASLVMLIAYSLVSSGSFTILGPPPRSIIFVDYVLSIYSVCGLRIGIRIYRERYMRGPVGENPRKNLRIAIVGAGDVGSAVAADMLARPGLGRRPVIFLDDNMGKRGRQIHGITIDGPVENLAAIKAKVDFDELLIAVGATPAKRVSEIVALCQANAVKCEIVPSLLELASGQVRASRVRPVEIEDLLGREAVQLDSANIREMIAGKVVMVTGAGGSIGSELCRQIASHAPARLVLLEQSEVQLFQIEQNLIDLGFSGVITPVVADILDRDRMRHVFSNKRPSIVFHAAAHKHVFLMERQPWEAVRNNSLGTATLADLASEFGVSRFVLISTDKAINPTNVMGASKRLAEIYLQARHASGGNKTCFAAVRFGNVLGSSGSVVPIFKKQIAAGGPVKVTHPDVTRYFMTIPEAVGLVLQCATQASGGEIFVLDMGKPMKIVDLARQMIELSGFRPDVDIPIEFVGLRAGEKLFEELQHSDERHQPTAHPRIMRFCSEPRPLTEVRGNLDHLTSDIYRLSANEVKSGLNRLIPEYVPHLD